MFRTSASRHSSAFKGTPSAETSDARKARPWGVGSEGAHSPRTAYDVRTQGEGQRQRSGVSSGTGPLSWVSSTARSSLQTTFPLSFHPPALHAPIRLPAAASRLLRGLRSRPQPYPHPSPFGEGPCALGVCEWTGRGRGGRAASEARRRPARACVPRECARRTEKELEREAGE